MSIKTKENFGLYIAFSCHVSLASFSLEKFLSLCLRHWRFWRKLVNYFVRCPSIWVCLMLLHQIMYTFNFKLLKFKVCVFDKNITKMMCSQRVVLEDTCQFIPLLLIVTGLGWILLMQSYYSFNVSCGEILWDSVNMLLLLKLSPARLSIHGWFLAQITCYSACQMAIF